jgi:hypothetical protein
VHMAVLSGEPGLGMNRCTRNLQAEDDCHRDDRNPVSRANGHVMARLQGSLPTRKQEGKRWDASCLIGFYHTLLRLKNAYPADVPCTHLWSGRSTDRLTSMLQNCM